MRGIGLQAVKSKSIIMSFFMLQNWPVQNAGLHPVATGVFFLLDAWRGCRCVLGWVEVVSMDGEGDAGGFCWSVDMWRFLTEALM